MSWPPKGSGAVLRGRRRWRLHQWLPKSVDRQILNASLRLSGVAVNLLPGELLKESGVKLERPSTRHPAASCCCSLVNRLAGGACSASRLGQISGPPLCGANAERRLQLIGGLPRARALDQDLQARQLGASRLLRSKSLTTCPTSVWPPRIAS